MRRFLLNLPLRHKLTALIMAISGVAVLLACVAFAISEQAALRRTMAANFEILADMVDDDLAPRLASRDSASIRQALRLLSAHHRIVAACVYDKHGVVIGEYHLPGSVVDTAFQFPAAQSTGQRFGSNRLDTFKDIEFAGQVIGAVYIGVELGELRELAWRYAAIAGLVLAVCSLVALVLAARLQRIVAQPIEDLAHTVATVATEKNYTVRASKQSDDELGRLVDGFNEMLAQIQARDGALLKTRDELEVRVAERTKELAREQARFKSIFDSVPVGISLVATDDLTKHLNNPAHERISGVSVLKSAEPNAYMRVSHPDDYRRQMELAQPFIRGETDHYSTEKRYLHPDGRVVWASLTSRKFTDSATGAQQSITTLVDITERKEADAELRWKTALLEAQVESSPDGILIVDAQRKRILQNRLFADLWKVPREIAEHPDTDRQVQFVRNQPKDPPAVAEKILYLYAHPDETSRDEIELKDGTVLDRYSSPVRGKDGTHYGRIWTVRDITERKRAEVKLAEASGLLEAMLENSPDLIYFKDRSSRFVRFSKACYVGFGLTGPEMLLGKTDADFYAAGQAQPVLADEQHILHTGRPIVGKLEKVDYADGRVAWLLTTKMPWRDGTGAIVGTFGISKDVTTLKEAEVQLAYERDQLRALLNSSPDAIYFKDAQSRFIHVSLSKVRNALARVPDLRARRTARGLLADVSEADLLTGMTDFDTFSGDDARLAYEDEQQIVRTGKAIIGKLEKQSFLDGIVRWSLTSKMPWCDPEGKTIGTFGISKDITDFKEAEEKLEQVNRQLMQASRQAGMAEVATGVLHNVGNVLNSVNVSATLVVEQVLHSKAGSVAKLATLFAEHKANLGDFLTKDARGKMIPSYLGTLSETLAEENKAIVTELEHLRKNVEHIKEIVSMQQSYATTSGVVESISVPDMIEDALRINAGSLTRHGVQAIRDYQARPVVTTDKHKVMQILINLIRNAKEACDGGGHTDKKLIVRTTSDDRSVKIAIIDNGVGIPPENLTRIFNHGFTTRKEGHGFGLHSGALAAKELGGSLNVQSDGPGHGAVFTLELPLKAAAPPS